MLSVAVRTIVAQPPGRLKVPDPALGEPARPLSHVLGVVDGVGLPEHLLRKGAFALPDPTVCLGEPLPLTVRRLGLP